MKKLLLPLATLALAACTNAARTSSALNDASEDPCAALQPTGDVATWLEQNQDQAQLQAIFSCAPASDPERLPLGIGHGHGTLYSQWPLWNDLQTSLGAYIWGGKRFYKDGDQTRLINLMEDSGTERYKAVVYVAPSILDGQPTIVLDYRVDDSVATLGPAQSPVQQLVDQVIHGIRDEIREVYVNGQPSGVFVGRAHLYSQVFSPSAQLAGTVFPIADTDFVNPADWTFAANFFLDFRGE